MTRAVEYHNAANRDFDESVDWYSQRSRDVATAFALAVDDANALRVEAGEVGHESPFHGLPFVWPRTFE
jgi:plasmid stabilization system protein ParE